MVTLKPYLEISKYRVIVILWMFCYWSRSKPQGCSVQLSESPNHKNSVWRYKCFTINTSKEITQVDILLTNIHVLCNIKISLCFLLISLKRCVHEKKNGTMVTLKPYLEISKYRVIVILWMFCYWSRSKPQGCSVQLSESPNHKNSVWRYKCFTINTSKPRLIFYDGLISFNIAQFPENKRSMFYNTIPIMMILCGSILRLLACFRI